jgi:hypothetical protein
MYLQCPMTIISRMYVVKYKNKLMLKQNVNMTDILLCIWFYVKWQNL